MYRTDWGTTLGRSLVFGGVAIMGGVLALAQVAAPPSNRAAPAQPQRDANNQRDANQPPAAAERELPRAPAQSTEAAPARQAGLGLEFDAQTQGGLSIRTVQPESLAAQAGMRQGDRIVTVDGRQFANQRQLQAYLSGQYGRRVPLVIDRGGQQYNVQLDFDQGGDVAWLGVFLQDAEEQAATQPQAGAKIIQVYPAGPAARAGLRPGDLVQQVNKQAVAGPAELIGQIEELKPGAKAELTVLRGNQPVAIPVILGNRSHFVFHGGGQQGQFREGQFDNGQFNDDDEFGNIPPHAMQLEHDRRMAEQHQRIEEELRKLQEEVRKLREALMPRND